MTTILTKYLYYQINLKFRVEDNLRASGSMNATIVTREDGIEIVQVDKTSIKELKFDRIYAKIRGLFNGNPVLSKLHLNSIPSQNKMRDFISI